MDRKKKIIIALVTLLFIAGLSGFIKFMLFPSKKVQEDGEVISIDIPSVDEKKLEKQSKIEKYEQEVMVNPKKGQKTTIATDTLNAEQVNPFGTSINWDSYQRQMKRVPDESPLIFEERSESMSEAYVDQELKELMELQNQLIAQSQQDGQIVYNGDDIDTLLKYYEQKGYPQGQETKSSIVNPSASEPTKGAAMTVERNHGVQAKETVPQRYHFQGAGSVLKKDNILDLIPAETIDEGVLKNGSTIAIRTKKAIRLPSSGVVIPNGAVVYGKVDISTDRLMIDLSSYRDNEKLYSINFSLYDFDGREGIHLGNRTWPKIPSKVAKDVYEYAYQKGTQANGAFSSGDTTIDLDEAKDIAILSSANHLGKEIFETRRVYIPRKYHLWFNVNVNIQ